MTRMNAAIAEDRTDEALRLADRAHRLVPSSPLLCRIAMSLWLRGGDAQQALRAFAAVSSTSLTSDLAALHVDALRIAARIEDARDALEHYLRRFAVEPDGALAKAARALADALGEECPGWIGISPEMQLVGDLRCPQDTNTLLLLLEQFGEEAETIIIAGMDGWCKPEAVANIPVLKDMNVQIEGMAARPMGASIVIPEDFGLMGTLDLDEGRVAGALRLSWLPVDSAPSLFLMTRGAKEPVDLKPDEAEPGTYRFEILPGSFGLLRPKTLDFAVALPDGRDIRLPGSPLSLRPVRPYQPPRSRSAKHNPVKGVAIVIPVYRGVQETRACIESVLATTEADVPIIVVDDASPQGEMLVLLEELAQHKRITLHSMKTNGGFPAAANRGMALAPDRDIILLNSDTMVFPGWLERLVAHAEADSSIATVTPLSNAGSIASYPGGEESVCDEDDAQMRDALAASVNKGRHVEAPTGVGFCMYIRRTCITELGGFDEQLFGRGYGEENDFCMRASAHGWRHVIAADTYVWHRNGVSFGTARDGLRHRNSAVLSARHPDYDSLVQAFHKAQPLAPLRREIDIAGLRARTKPIALLISLALDGGVKRFVDERVAALEQEGYQPLLLRPVNGGAQAHLLVPGAQDRFKDLRFAFGADVKTFDDLMCSLPVERVELHHFLGMDEAFVDASLALDAPVDIYIHDYSWYCPRLTLLGKRGVYCGEPGAAACRSCIKQTGSELHDGVGPDILRARSTRWLACARTIYAPCADVVRRYERVFPKMHFQVTPWERDIRPLPLPEPGADAPCRIVVPGAIGEQKGEAILLACARHAALHDLPLEFVVIGFTADEKPLLETGKVFITGRYTEDELPALLRREAPAAAFLPSVTPETWSYSLSHMLGAGLPVLAFDLGAIAERLGSAQVAHQLADIDSPPAQLNEMLIELARQPREQPELLLTMPQPPPFHDNIAKPLSLSIQSPGVSIMSDMNAGLTSSAEYLTLARGLYHFSVVSEGSGSLKDALPALQIVAAPGQQKNDIECVSSPSAEHQWLCSGQDSVILKINKDRAQVVVILLTKPGLSPLQIDVRKLDGDQRGGQPEMPAYQAAQPAPPPNGTTPSTNPGIPLLRSQIVAHVEYVGDMIGMDQDWAGSPQGGRAIECISITPVANIAPAAIEYKTVNAAGTETPWTDQGRPSGTRGLATPLLGFAIRQRPQAAARFLCEYSGRFASGQIVGPVQDGAMCRSPHPNDRLEGIWFHIIDLGGAAQHGQGRGGAQPHAGGQQPVGPKFSVFREIPA